MIQLVELLDTDTDIDWWNKNRQRLNEVISSFNEWQTEYRFDAFKKEVIQSKIVLCRKFGDENDFSDWQYEILNDMESFLKEHSTAK